MVAGVPSPLVRETQIQAADFGFDTTPADAHRWGKDSDPRQPSHSVFPQKFFKKLGNMLFFPFYKLVVLSQVAVTRCAACFCLNEHHTFMTFSAFLATSCYLLLSTVYFIVLSYTLHL